MRVFPIDVVTVSVPEAVVLKVATALCLSSGSSEDKSSPATERPEQDDVVDKSPKERPSPRASPSGGPTSERSDSSSSDSSGSSDDDDDDDDEDDEHETAHRRIRSSVAQIRVSQNDHRNA